MSDPTEINTGGPPQIPGWTPPPDLVGTVLADRYKVLSVLGDGGMGRVYLGEHVTLRKKVAIKVLKQEFCHDRTNVERFLQEARAASMIRHENIVDIMDFGQVPGGSVFFVMELLEGSDLSDLLKETENKRLPWLRTRNILLQVVRALRAAHESGIIHRDMKPANVFLIKRSGATDYVKVLDFGIAKVDDSASGLTRTGAVFGTAGYMAPEQACGDPVDSRTDVYAVGCMMFEMLTGRTPFPGNNFMRVLTQHMNEPPPAPRDVAPDADISDEVETIILTALAKKQEDRFRDMAAFEKAIAQANGEVATVPPQNRPRTEKGTVVLDDDAGPNPFANMTPGKPPPGYESNGSTMMLEGGLDAPAGDGATMMLDGMGGISLGEGGGDGATMMLDMGDAKLSPEPAATPEVAAAPVAAEPDEGQDKKKLFMMIGGGVLALVVIIVLAVVLFGGDKGDGDAVANNDAKADDGKETEGPVDDADETGEAVPVADEGPPADDGALGDDGALAAAEGGVDSTDDGAADDGLVAMDDGAAADDGAADDGAADDGLAAADDGGEPDDTGTEQVNDVNNTKKTPAKVKDSLTDADVNRGLKRIQKKISACTNQGGLPGMAVKVNFLIVNGKVTSASSRGAHASTPVGRCVAGAIKKARFSKAKNSKIVDTTVKL